MRPRRVALLVAVVGLLCLPAPIYLGWVAETAAPPPKSSQVYGADARDPTDASDRKHLVYRHAGAVALSTHRVSERYSAGEYRAPNESRRTLERAMASGSATTDDPGAKADLRELGAEYAFVYDASDDSERRSYRRLTVTENGSRVATESVTPARVANETIDRLAVEYASLSPGERRTVDRVLESDSGYRPRVDDPFADRLPALVWVDGTLYSLHVVGHADDFGPGFAGFVVGLGVAAVGALLVLAGGVTYLLARRRD